MKIKVQDLIGPALDWAVAKCNGREIHYYVDDPFKREPWLVFDGIADMPLHAYTPSTDWAQGGPIIERECIAVSCIHTTGYTPNTWDAKHPQRVYANGPTPLIAAMRCYVASKLGDEVDVPEELK